jgi:hypothetical protein
LFALLGAAQVSKSLVLSIDRYLASSVAHLRSCQDANPDATNVAWLFSFAFVADTGRSPRIDLSFEFDQISPAPLSA